MPAGPAHQAVDHWHGRRKGGRRLGVRHAGRLGGLGALAGSLAHLDGAAGRQRRGADHGRDLAGAEADRAARRRAADGRGTAADRCDASAGGGRAARAEPDELGGGQRERPAVERGERAAHAAQRDPVLAAAGAVAQVLASVGRRLDAAVVAPEQVGADVLAGRVARLRCLDQPDTRAHEQRLDGGHRDVERARQIGIRHAVDLPHQQRRPLLLGQPAHVLDQAREVVAALRLLDRVAQRLAREVEDVGRRRDRAAQVIDATVVGDAVQPRPQVNVSRVGPQRAVRADEDVLEQILSVLARPRRQHLAHVGEQALAVAVVDDAEGLVAAGAEEREQLLVRAQAQERRPERPEAGPGRRAHC